MNATDPIRYRAQLTPDAIAIIETDDRRLTYAMLDRCVDGMVVHLRRLGVQAGDVARVATQPPDQSAMLTVALALMRMGATAAEPSLPDGVARLTFMPAAMAAPGAIAVDRSWMTPADPSPITHDPLAPARIFASSGTTGGRGTRQSATPCCCVALPAEACCCRLAPLDG